MQSIFLQSNGTVLTSENDPDSSVVEAVFDRTLERRVIIEIERKQTGVNKWQNDFVHRI